MTKVLTEHMNLRMILAPIFKYQCSPVKCPTNICSSCGLNIVKNCSSLCKKKKKKKINRKKKSKKKKRERVKNKRFVSEVA